MLKRLLASSLLLSGPAHAQTSEEQDLALAYGDSASISLATGAKQALRRAPAVASVFTAEDIRALGATDLSQVLELVPGLHVGRSFFLYENQYQLRGVQGSFNQQLLFLIDGVRRQTADLGGAEEVWANMPVENIARVEVIRGPGSALYGADAFSGVVSITTKSAADVPGGRLAALLGSYGERAASLQHAGTAGALSWAAYLRLGRSDGPDEPVEADAQTALDALFGSHASLAPGAIDTRHKDLDLNLQLGWLDWQLHFSHRRRSGVGFGAGLAHALGQGSSADGQRSTLSLAYQTRWQDWELHLRAALEQDAVDSYIVLFPPGAFGGAYPEGMIGAPGRATRYGGVSAVATYGAWSGHQLRLGLGSQLTDMYRTSERKNFDFVFIPGVGQFPAPLGSLVDVSASRPYIRPHERRLHYLLVQDEWSLSKDWTLTAGLRHDRYSDFGSTTNPRLALVWEAAYNLTLKLLHGTAFRAPTFGELYNINNPVALGNPASKPERMATSELAMSWQAGPGLQVAANLFRYRMSDILRDVPNADPLTGATTANQGTQKGRGLEAELRWQARRDLRLLASYAYQRSIDGLTGQSAGYAPRQMLKAGADWQFAPDWAGNAQLRHIAGRQRGAGDARPPIADYSLLDLALHWRREAQQGWSLLFCLRNALDADAREPSPAPGNVPNDFPLPRRNWVVQAAYAY